jgi:hypothetical protein
VGDSVDVDRFGYAAGPLVDGVEDGRFDSGGSDDCRAPVCFANEESCPVEEAFFCNDLGDVQANSGSILDLKPGIETGVSLEFFAGTLLAGAF